MLPGRRPLVKVLLCGLMVTLQAGELQLVAQGAVHVHLGCREERINIIVSIVNADLIRDFYCSI